MRIAFASLLVLAGTACGAREPGSPAPAAEAATTVHGRVEVISVFFKPRDRPVRRLFVRVEDAECALPADRGENFLCDVERFAHVISNPYLFRRWNVRRVRRHLLSEYRREVVSTSFRVGARRDRGRRTVCPRPGSTGLPRLLR